MFRNLLDWINRRKGAAALVVSVALIIWFVAYYWSLIALAIFGGTTRVPERPDSVPDGAVWAGGPDGGEWIDCLPIKDSAGCFRCDMYSDQSGEQYEQFWWGNGIYCSRNGEYTMDSLMLLYSGFDGTVIHLTNGDVLIPDISNLREASARIQTGMTLEDVCAAAHNALYAVAEDSVYSIWKIDVPYFVTERPEYVFGITDSVLLAIRWVDSDSGR